ncbi:hypothetical protein Lalb_Chr09g0323391 [Lupinus albus]|uniref:Uncharacterized protein n=1 Tax=Lupinus albus TaxID=3870 RepID=A0A6A4PZ18_LUPAL|nr:hypothetical protein Lalb_Chr09g0323391 [Lupinus albus]
MGWMGICYPTFLSSSMCQPIIFLSTNIDLLDHFHLKFVLKLKKLNHISATMEWKVQHFSSS